MCGPRPPIQRKLSASRPVLFYIRNPGTSHTIKRRAKDLTESFLSSQSVSHFMIFLEKSSDGETYLKLGTQRDHTHLTRLNDRFAMPLQPTH